MVIDDETHQHSDHAHTVLNFLCQWRLLEHDINNDNEKKPYVQNTRRNDYSSWTFFASFTSTQSKCPLWSRSRTKIGFQRGPRAKTQVSSKTKTTCRLRMTGLSTYLCNTKNICFDLELFRAQRCWFALHQWRAGKGWFRAKYAPLPHVPI